MITLFHGSNVVVENPKILENGFYKNFGYGFYCTIYEKQAKRWALTKRKNHVVNKYLYDENRKLQIKKFPKMTEEWLEFVVSCRREIKHDMVFCTEKALQALKFEGSYSL